MERLLNKADNDFSSSTFDKGTWNSKVPGFYNGYELLCSWLVAFLFTFTNPIPQAHNNGLFYGVAPDGRLCTPPVRKITLFYRVK
jgi:hypothetical protein